MQKYTDKNATPLKYHKFMRYFAFPVTAGLSAVTIIMTIFFGNRMNYAAMWLKAADIVFLVIALVLAVITIIESRKWTPLGWYTILIYFSVQTGYAFFSTVTEIIYNSMSIPYIIGRFIAIIICTVLIFIYYFKRRLLFDGILPQKRTTPEVSEEKF